MNSMIWKCRGAGGITFASMIKDFLTIYQLDFVAILEPRISGVRSDKVIQIIDLVEGARVDAQGLPGGIWCLSFIYASPNSGNREDVWQ